MALTAPGQPQASDDCAIYAPHPASVSAGVSLISMPVDIFDSVLGHLSLNELIKATHVCSYWRSAVLESPALWASSVHIAGLRPALLEEILRRSKAAPLDVSLTNIYARDPHDVEDYISSVTRRMSQVLRLRLSPPSRGKRWSLGLAPPRIHLDLSRGHPEHLEALLTLNPLHSLDIYVTSPYKLSTILSLIQASPDLRNLTLKFGHDFSDAWRDVSSHVWNGVMARRMDSLAMSYSSEYGTFATRTILSALDTALIRRICLTNWQASEMDHFDILSTMEPPIRLEFLIQSLYVESPRGLVRKFEGHAVKLLDPLPLLRFVVTLTLPITTCWDHISEPLVFLEHLTLVGEPESLTSATTTPKIHPSLRTVTLWLWLPDSDRCYSLSETLGTSIAFVAMRISGYARPLERLALLVQGYLERQYLVRHPAIPAALVEVRHWQVAHSERSWFPPWTPQGHLDDDMDDGDAVPGVEDPR
ncbi:hypothetical protein EXIGLDRAFT_832049 [Exidia glandulosa HHB12029]|uniref:F-box domain-containing protein n=1 Tax=Exidia glandulosa HHB12029 TaxID=1314781 RepID=A0A165M1U0_EXIGL|nr:hypothetical protein EXIGLDRAFT_832049 [Exidia glandulosa HHB12029]